MSIKFKLQTGKKTIEMYPPIRAIRHKMGVIKANEMMEVFPI